MKRRRGIIIVACSMLGVSGLALLAVRYGRTSPGIAHHNSVLEQCLSLDVEIQIKCKDARNPETFSKMVAVAGKERTAWLLDRIRINEPPEEEGLAHSCRGHLVITIKTSEYTHQVQYDHGIGIYPISDGTYSVGFVDLEPSVCSELNEYFRSLGFTNEELGIPPG